MRSIPVLVFLLLLATASSHAEDVKDPKALQEQLRALEAEIADYKRLLEETESERSNLESTLESNEKNINELLKKIETIQKDLDAGEEKLSKLKSEQRELELAKLEQQKLIARQVRAAYEIGNQEYLKVVLNQEDPNQLARMLTYYDYFNRARASQVESFKSTIAQLDTVSQQIVVQNLTLVENRSAISAQKTVLDGVQKDKELTLAALIKDLEKTGSELQIRQKDRERLEGLLERITAGIVNLPTPADILPFQNRKGQLLLPVVGNVTDRFGSARTGKLKWNGVFIEANEGEPVAAVHYGRVVFSDWLRGFGLLLIINHGDGYMSLYGHNQVLYRETGDWVTAGETIATVGNTGGQNRSGLYFEIRHAGKPADPQQWCQARPKRTA